MRRAMRAPHRPASAPEGIKLTSASDDSRDGSVGHAPGECGVCGYDLRASGAGGRCAECGTSVAAARQVAELLPMGLARARLVRALLGAVGLTAALHWGLRLLPATDFFQLIRVLDSVLTLAPAALALWLVLLLRHGQRTWWVAVGLLMVTVWFCAAAFPIALIEYARISDDFGDTVLMLMGLLSGFAALYAAASLGAFIAIALLARARIAIPLAVTATLLSVTLHLCDLWRYHVSGLPWLNGDIQRGASRIAVVCIILAYGVACACVWRRVRRAVRVGDAARDGVHP